MSDPADQNSKRDVFVRYLTVRLIATSAWTFFLFTTVTPDELDICRCDFGIDSRLALAIGVLLESQTTFNKHRLALVQVLAGCFSHLLPCSHTKPCDEIN